MREISRADFECQNRCAISNERARFSSTHRSIVTLLLSSFNRARRRNAFRHKKSRARDRRIAYECDRGRGRKFKRHRWYSGTEDEAQMWTQYQG